MSGCCGYSMSSTPPAASPALRLPLVRRNPPTVSIWLGRLREELNDQLFVRTPSGMIPTPRADELIGTVRAAIDLLQRLHEGPPPTIRLRTRAAFAFA